MTPEERQLLIALADRIKSAPAQDQDPEAEQALLALVRDRPDTTYLLAQTVLMQDFALRNAQAQIAELQRQRLQGQPASAPQRGSFLSGLFGGGPAQAGGSVPGAGPWGRPMAPPPAYPPPGYGPVVMQPSQTSGFLRSAASTAAGIAGGALLFEGIQSLFSGHQGLGGGFLGGGGFTPRDSLSETTINNYYGDQPGAGGQQAADYQPGSSQIDPGLTDPGLGNPGFAPDQGATDQGSDYLDVSDPGTDVSTDAPGDYSSDDLGGGSDYV